MPESQVGGRLVEEVEDRPQAKDEKGHDAIGSVLRDLVNSRWSRKLRQRTADAGIPLPTHGVRSLCLSPM